MAARSPALVALSPLALPGLARMGAPRPLQRLLALTALRRSRLRLRELDDHRLRDLGLTRAEAASEAEKPLWDAPAHWLR